TLRVIVFSDRAREIYSSQTHQPDFARLAESLRQVKPTGATNVLPAIELATKQPPPSKRHNLLIIVSDLQTEKFDPPQAADMLKKAKLDLAIVAIAAPASTPSVEPLETLKKLLNAPLEKRDHLVGLARIFAGFLRTARGEPTRRGLFTLRSQTTSPDSDALAGKSADAYILSAPHPDATVTLQIASDALVARRTVGLGRSVAIALASSNRANRALLATKEFIDVLARATKWSARPDSDPRFSGEVARSGRQAIITLRAATESELPINMLRLSVRILAGVDKSARMIPMQQIAPGQYQANFALDQSASDFHVVEDGRSVVWQGGLQKTYPREFDAIGPDYTNLRRLASLTGGQVVEPRELTEILRASGRTGRWELWYWFAGLALAMMLLDWLVSRTIQHKTEGSG
ncbi:MAG: VWA domain-containing protein, partial [bacterium]|nr:VWA domain-containing protein [bacterium]